MSEEKLQLVEATFQQVIGKYRIMVVYRNYKNPYMACWAQEFNSFYCLATDEYRDDCYDYPWEHFIRSTGYSDNDAPIPITAETAARDIQASYKELTISPEEKRARRERTERIKQEIRERLKKQGIIK